MTDATPSIECPTCGACIRCGDAATRERIQALRPEGERDE
jgi:endogenous inhibitor of DNA gyrase (YacG/DUF329 family)